MAYTTIETMMVYHCQALKLLFLVIILSIIRFSYRGCLAFEPLEFILPKQRAHIIQNPLVVRVELVYLPVLEQIELKDGSVEMTHGEGFESEELAEFTFSGIFHQIEVLVSDSEKSLSINARLNGC